MITIHRGDVLNSGADVIAHGVNCSGGFGSGVAGTIAERLPAVKDAYLQKFNEVGWELGEVQFVPIGTSTGSAAIANCATQYNYGSAGKRYCSYGHIKECMIRLRDFMSTSSKENLILAMPRIGAGLGGGDWKIIEDIILEVFSDSNIEVQVWVL